MAAGAKAAVAANGNIIHLSSQNEILETMDRADSVMKRIHASVGNALAAVRDILYGMTIYDWTRELEKARGQEERLFILVVFGDLLGVPILPPYYTLRLLPYIVPAIEGWQRSMLRERDFTDIINQDIG